MIMQQFFMNNYNLIPLSSTSKGNVMKWHLEDFYGLDLYIKAPLFYNGVYCKDYLAEVVGYRLCRQLGLNAVMQDVCYIHSKEYTGCGCFSKNFKKDEEQFHTFSSLLKKTSTPFIKSVEFIFNEYTRLTGLDVKEWFSNMILVDYLLLNDDRHLNNFGVLLGPDGYSLHPYFDFGSSLGYTEPSWELEDVLNKTKSKPISTSFEKQLKSVCKWVTVDLSNVDVNACFEGLDNIGPGRMILRRRLRKAGEILATR